MSTLYTIVSFLEAKPGKEQALQEVLLKLKDLTLEKEPGCVDCYLYQDPNNLKKFMLYQDWISQEAREKHVESPHFWQSHADIDALITKPYTLTAWKMVK